MWEVKRQPENLKNGQIPQRVRIHLKNSATVAFSWHKDKDLSINQSYKLKIGGFLSLDDNIIPGLQIFLPLFDIEKTKQKG